MPVKRKGPLESCLGTGPFHKRTPYLVTQGWMAHRAEVRGHRRSCMQLWLPGLLLNSVTCSTKSKTNVTATPSHRRPLTVALEAATVLISQGAGGSVSTGVGPRRKSEVVTNVYSGVHMNNPHESRGLLPSASLGSKPILVFFCGNRHYCLHMF